MKTLRGVTGRRRILTIHSIEPDSCSNWWEPLQRDLTVARPKSPIFTVRSSWRKISGRRWDQGNTLTSSTSKLLPCKSSAFYGWRLYFHPCWSVRKMNPNITNISNIIWRTQRPRLKMKWLNEMFQKDTVAFQISVDDWFGMQVTEDEKRKVIRQTTHMVKSDCFCIYGGTHSMPWAVCRAMSISLIISNLVSMMCRWWYRLEPSHHWVTMASWGLVV